MTAAAGLYINLGLPFEADESEPATVLIWVSALPVQFRSATFL